MPVDAGERSKLDEAKGFLEDILNVGPMASSEVEKDAKGAGISPTTLKRAKTTLGIQARKAGFGQGWLWELPSRRGPSTPEDAHTKTMSAFGKHDLLRAKEDGWEEV